jgi:hypothetical protein
MGVILPEQVIGDDLLGRMQNGDRSQERELLITL